MPTHFTTSADGTRLAYETHGRADAPIALWVHGATMFRALHDVPGRVADLTGLRVIDYDRRGRGESGDTAPYALEREIEDIAAIIETLGGRVAALIGESSGAVLALEAARAGVAADRVIAYEPAVVVDDSRPPLPGDYVERLDAAAASDDPAEAFRIFFVDAVGLPEEMAQGVTFAPNWEQLASAAHTIRYDGRFMAPLSIGDPAPLARYAEVSVPVLVGIGADTWPFLTAAGEAVAAALPDARVETFPGGTHQTDPALVAPAFSAFVRRES
ncbi:alpha/beta hydrolase [Corynebacterium sp. USCH3]|uniref:alpha/beta fold hydrolase n=1 Tax=Corynebacterium sp. USCH3 TaxID=3024840 RepID=UPI0030B23A82